MSAVPTVHVPVEVHVVRPKRTGSDLASMLIAGVLSSLVVAWILMLIAGEVVPGWGVSYTDALLTLAAARLLQLGSSSRMWTHKAKGSVL